MRLRTFNFDSLLIKSVNEKNGSIVAKQRFEIRDYS